MDHFRREHNTRKILCQPVSQADRGRLPSKKTREPDWGDLVPILHEPPTAIGGDMAVRPAAQNGAAPQAGSSAKQSASGATTFSSMENGPPRLCTPPRHKAGPHRYTINDATMRLCGADHPASRHSVVAGGSCIMRARFPVKKTATAPRQKSMDGVPEPAAILCLPSICHRQAVRLIYSSFSRSRVSSFFGKIRSASFGGIVVPLYFG